MIRAFLALLLLGFTASVSAQVIVGDEVVSDPLRPRAGPPLRLAAPAVSLAKDRTGIAIAWTMANGSGADRVYIARLNDSGHVAGSVREMPLAAPAAQTHQMVPSIAAAPEGDGFVAAWLEIDGSNPTTARAVVSRLDAALQPSAPSMLFPTLLPIAPAVVRTKSAKTWISAGGFLWTLAAGGAMEGPLAGLVASDMTLAGGVPQLVGSHPLPTMFYTCRPGCYIPVGQPFATCVESCRIYSDYYALDLTAPPNVIVTKTFFFASAVQPAIESRDGEVVVVWFRGAQTSGGDVVASRAALTDLVHFADQPVTLASFRPDAGETRPAIAADDGVLYAAVWRTIAPAGDHDIAGAVMASDGKLTPLTIAATAADERDPAILALGGGTFLVAYETITGTERRIAGRFVTFGRRRATR
ncbi:MAG TPA: hypothetical protein VI670_22840 [Thermoanaerobaculia bacterium]